MYFSFSCHSARKLFTVLLTFPPPLPLLGSILETATWGYWVSSGTPIYLSCLYQFFRLHTYLFFI
jgi:hypothetical protein